MKLGKIGGLLLAISKTLRVFKILNMICPWVPLPEIVDQLA